MKVKTGIKAGGRSLSEYCSEHCSRFLGAEYQEMCMKDCVALGEYVPEDVISQLNL